MISEKEAATRRRKIKLSAYILFQEKGVDDVTYGNIAEHSGISESSIYHYFPKKSILIIETHKDLWREIASELKARTMDVPAFQKADGYRRVELLIDAFEQVHLTSPGYLKFALECKLYWIRRKYVINREEYSGIMEPVMQQFTDAIQKGVDDKSICLQANFESCSFLIWGILRSYIEQMIVLDALYSEESYFSHYFQTLKKMLMYTLHDRTNERPCPLSQNGDS